VALVLMMINDVLKDMSGLSSLCQTLDSLFFYI